METNEAEVLEHAFYAGRAEALRGPPNTSERDVMRSGLLAVAAKARELDAARRFTEEDGVDLADGTRVTLGFMLSRWAGLPPYDHVAALIRTLREVASKDAAHGRTIAALTRARDDVLARKWVQCTSVSNDCLGGCRSMREHDAYRQRALTEEVECLRPFEALHEDMTRLKRDAERERDEARATIAAKDARIAELEAEHAETRAMHSQMCGVAIAHQKDRDDARDAQRAAESALATLRQAFRETAMRTDPFDDELCWCAYRRSSDTERHGPDCLPNRELLAATPAEHPDTATLRAIRERATNTDALWDAFRIGRTDADGVHEVVRHLLGDSSPNGGPGGPQLYRCSECGEPRAEHPTKECSAWESSGSTIIGPSGGGERVAITRPIDWSKHAKGCRAEWSVGFDTDRQMVCAPDCPSAPTTPPAVAASEGSLFDACVDGSCEHSHAGTPSHIAWGRKMAALPENRPLSTGAVATTPTPTHEEDWRTVEKGLQHSKTCVQSLANAPSNRPCTCGVSAAREALTRLKDAPRRAAERMRERCAAMCESEAAVYRRGGNYAEDNVMRGAAKVIRAFEVTP